MLSFNITLISLIALILVSKEWREEHCWPAVLLGQLSLFAVTLSSQALALPHSELRKSNRACAANVAPSTGEMERPRGAKAANH